MGQYRNAVAGLLAQLHDALPSTAEECSARLELVSWLWMYVCVTQVLWSTRRFQCHQDVVALLRRLPRPRQELLLPQRLSQHAACGAGAASDLARALSVPEQPPTS